MRCLEVVRHKQRLDHLFQQIALLREDVELQSHWARYLCVLVSGFIESSVREIYREYVTAKASPQVVNYAENQLGRFQNPSMERILELTRAFDPSWESALRVASEGEIKDAVDSVVNNRHRIAHGESVGITYARMSQYYTSTQKLLELIDRQCNS